MQNRIWMEKWRPKSLEEMVLEPSTRELLQKFISDGMIPHLLLSGNVGCGKTTIAKILINSLDCDSITLNASDERGIQIIRDKVKSFAMMSSFKKWKIVFLDESDAVTPEAQMMLRNLMETYSEHTRFILTCNYLNKIIDPIRSRCQCIEFNELGRKDIRKLLQRMLDEEKIEYKIDDLLVLIDACYPDIRSMINNLQLYSKNGKWKIEGTEKFKNVDKLVDLLKKGDLRSIRELALDFVEAMRYLFDRVEELTEDKQKQVDISLLLAERLYKDVFIPDKLINFSACCLEIIEMIKK